MDTGEVVRTSLLDLITSPIEAMVGVTSAVTEGVTSVVSGEPGKEPPFNEDTLRLIVYQLWHGDARLQQDVLAAHYSPDAVFSAGAASSIWGPEVGGLSNAYATAVASSSSVGEQAEPAGGKGPDDTSEGPAGAEPSAPPVPLQPPAAEVVQVGAAPLLVQVRGRDAMARVLRGAQLLARVTPEIQTVAINPDHALILATLKIAWRLLPLTWWRPVRADTLILLRFGADDKIASHAHIGSWASLLWAPLWQNALVDWLLRLWEPVSGGVLAAVVRYVKQLLSNAKRGRSVGMAQLHGASGSRQGPQELGQGSGGGAGEGKDEGGGEREQAVAESSQQNEAGVARGKVDTRIRRRSAAPAGATATATVAANG